MADPVLHLSGCITGAQQADKAPLVREQRTDSPHSNDQSARNLSQQHCLLESADGLQHCVARCRPANAESLQLRDAMICHEIWRL